MRALELLDAFREVAEHVKHTAPETTDIYITSEGILLYTWIYDDKRKLECHNLVPYDRLLFAKAGPANMLLYAAGETLESVRSQK